MVLEINFSDFNLTTIITFLGIIVSYLKLSDNLGFLGNFGKYLKGLNILRTKSK